MGIIREFIKSMRPTNCDGCGQALKVCDRQCNRAAAVDREWQDSIK